MSQCTCRCVVLPDPPPTFLGAYAGMMSQCTCRCVVLPDGRVLGILPTPNFGLNAPAGAWCSLTKSHGPLQGANITSQCTCRCVVLPDYLGSVPTMVSMVVSQCTCRCVVLPDVEGDDDEKRRYQSQCTCRCVVLPDPCPRERRYDATSRARSATGPGSTPPDRPAPGPE